MMNCSKSHEILRSGFRLASLELLPGNLPGLVLAKDSCSGMFPIFIPK